jgi:acetolactate synthase-1/2/3 large subunit
MRKIRLADYVARFVASRGIRHVFMVPGGGAMHLDDAFGYQPELTLVGNLHEQASAYAAEAWSRISGKAGCALVTSGPGATNAISGVAGAWLDSIPLLVISGQVKRADLRGDSGVRQKGVQEIDIVTMVGSIAKHAVTIMDPSTIRYHLEKAMHLAESGRPGPVWIDVPLDVQGSQIDEDALVGFDAAAEAASAPGASTQLPDDELRTAVRRTIDLLNAAERPVLLAGFGLRLAGAEAELQRVVEALGIPVLTTWPAMDLIPDAHPLLVGRPGPLAPRGANFALQNSDFLLSVGARLDLAISGYAPEKFARAARKVMVDIDPAELRKMGPLVDVPVCADARRFAAELLAQRERIRPRDRSGWLERCARWKVAWPLVQPEHRSPASKVSIYHFTEQLSELLPEGALVVSGSAGLGIELFLLCFRAKAGQRIFCSTALGAMGCGVPHALGACLAGGGRPTVCVDGDGGFQFNVQELQTVGRLGLPIKYFVLNNAGYASIRTSQQRYFGRLAGADAASGLTLPDVTKVAAAYGVATARISGQADLAGQIRRVLELPGPVVCDVELIPDEARAPAMTSVQRPNGSMVSKPLEDLWPFLDRSEFAANMIIPPLDEA